MKKISTSKSVNFSKNDLERYADDDNDDDDDNDTHAEEETEEEAADEEAESFNSAELEEENDEESIDPRTLLTQEQVENMKEIFMLLQPDQSGKVPAKVLGTVIRSLGYNPTQKEIAEHVAGCEADALGMMNFQGFLLPIARVLQREPETPEQILKAFKLLDENDNDYLTRSEFSYFMVEYGECLEDFELELLLKMADPRNESKIYYYEFLDRIYGTQKKPKKGGKDKDKKKKKK